MLKWCSYCQEFMREVVPYDDFGITHGVCVKCDARHPDLFADDPVGRARFLSGIFHELFHAGRHADFSAAELIVENAMAENCRPVDILIGMIAPMLYEIGEEWKRGVVTVDDEHRFTAFCQRVVNLVETKINPNSAPTAVSGGKLLFLMNAPGNRHSLAVRILALWLEGRGAKVNVVDDEIDIDDLLRSIAVERPAFILVSMATAEQREDVARIAAAIGKLPLAVQPKVVVGGYPVKTGLICSIPAAELVSDISALDIG